MLNFTHSSGCNGTVSITAKNAAKILNVTLKTIKNYLLAPDKINPAHLDYLEIKACRRVIPKSWQVWIDGDTLHTNSGYSFNKCEIESIGWLRATFLNQQNENKRLNLRIKELEEELKKSQKKAVKLPDNVVKFKPR
jgi:hypothetical protein